MRYAEVSQKELKFLDMTSLTVEEFEQLVPSFEEAFQERMQQWRLDGKRRSGRGYTTYANCPLPTPEDRLLFILVYLKTNMLQVLQGELFGPPQNKANPTICATRWQQANKEKPDDISRKQKSGKVVGSFNIIAFPAPFSV
jgi:hypothetical protein